VHLISRGSQEHGSYGNNGTATYRAIGDAGRVLSLWYVGAGFMFIGPLPMAIVAETFSWQIAISGGAARFLLISLGLGLLRPYLGRLTIQRAGGQYLSGPVVHTALKFGLS